jgi:hypothetical protein
MMLGQRVTLADGRSGQVVAEYDSWQNEQGIHHGHRLRVAVSIKHCSECPHQPGLTFVTVNAGDVTTP